MSGNVNVKNGERAKTNAGAGPALEGYFYQLDVSILTALELLLARKQSRSLILEPATQEDLESDVEGCPGALVESIELNAYHLVVQCKLRNTGAWKVADLSRLLRHGRHRQCAAKRLENPEIRYLLVTNTDVEASAHHLCIHDVGEWPRSEAIPPSIAKHLPDTALGRLAILSVLDAEKVGMRIERLLADRFHVPRVRHADCRKALWDEALLRMRGAGDGMWTREDLERVIDAHGGFIGESRDLADFVPPTNWDHLKQKLSDQHAVIIAGPSGTGKTRTAKALIAWLRNDIRDVEVVYIGGGGPEKVAQEKRRPVVFEIEDPWGKFRLEPGSAPWNDTIEGLLRGAGPERKFVITSRSDVLRESSPKHLHRWIVKLEPENYRNRERARLFKLQVERLPRELQSLVRQHRKRAIEALETPLEMERYFAALSEGFFDGEFEEQYIRRCTDEAHQGSIERSIVQNVRGRQDWRWAAVVWGLFKARERQSFSLLPTIQARLTERDPEFEDGLIPYVQFLIGGQHLRQSEATVFYRHPRVELGLEQALNEKPELASRALRYLVEAFVSIDTNPGQDWGAESAAHLVEAVRQQPFLKARFGAGAQESLDRWIQQRLAVPAQSFADDLRLAAAVGSTSCLAAELARWLLNSDEIPGVGAFDSWAQPAISVEWQESVRADGATKSICEAFIRFMLPMDHSNLIYRCEFVDAIQKLAPDLAPAFREAAISIVHDGYNSNAETIAYGALFDIEGFEAVISACLDVEASVRMPLFDEEWLAFTNGEYDATEEHVVERGAEQGHTAGVLLSAYVGKRRRIDSWERLRDHGGVADLLSHWIGDIDQDATDEELLALARLVRKTPNEVQFWELADRYWREVFGGALWNCMLDGGEDVESLAAMVNTFALHLTEEIPVLAQRLQAGGHSDRVLAIAAHLAAATAKLSQNEDKAARREIAQLALEQLANAVPEPLAEAVRRIAEITPTCPSAAVIEFLQSMNAGRDKVLKFAQARVLAAGAVDTSRLLEELLDPVRDSEQEIHLNLSALELAIRHNVWSVAESSLGHRFAAVRERALNALAARASGQLSPSLLGLAADKGRNVRRALFKIVNERRHAEHVDALVTLAADTWTPVEFYPEELMTYPIARSAAATLHEMAMFAAPHVTRIAEIALRSDDLELAQSLFEVMLESGAEEGRQRVMRVALQTGSPPYHRLAARALFSQAHLIDEKLVAQIPVARLERASPAVALPLACLVAARAASSQVREAQRALAARPRRRALLVPMYLCMAGRRNVDSQELRELLPGEVSKELMSAARGDVKLPRNALDALGDVGIVEAIIREFSQFFRSSTDEQVS